MPLMCWLLVVLVINRSFGTVLGVPYLFLDPEYLDKVGFVSFFIVGLALGLMMVSFHITSYILFSSKYSFVGILSFPFSKFSVNNSLIPVLVLVNYIVAIFFFQVNSEYTTMREAMKMVTALILGMVVMVALFYQYFRSTNKDIFRFLAGSVDKRLKRSKANRANALNKLQMVKKKSYHVDNYLDLKLRVRSTQGLHDFYDKESVLKVFDQNHLNSFIIEIFILGFIFISGFFVEVKYFQIPAAATSMLLLSLTIMLLGAISYWFRGWVVTTIFGLFLVLNALVQSGMLHSEFQAIGLDYGVTHKEYSLQSIEQTMTNAVLKQDRENTENILVTWKAKQAKEKPKAVFLCVSGGGLRSALWTTNVLQTLNKELDGRLMDKIVLITGASGGMIGASYFRELHLRSKSETTLDINSGQILENIAKDNLNPILLSLFVNDLFIRYHTYDYAGRSYLRDRGIAFENHLNRNTEGVMDKKLVDYHFPEQKAIVPMLILGPTIANDGRKMYLSAQKVSYMTMQTAIDKPDEYLIDGVDFLRFFERQSAKDLKFISALRMNASFPYITPNITLPSDPGMVVMDAGVADNFGISDAIRFVHNFKDWFESNTSGIIFLSIRDTKKRTEIEPKENLSILNKFSSPISSVYNNLANLQDINNDNKMRIMRDAYQGEIDFMSIEYDKDALIMDEGKAIKSGSASLSWHLTTKEKRNLIANIKTEQNQKTVKAFLATFKTNDEP